MMTIREKLDMMEDIKRKNRKAAAEYMRIQKWERRLNALENFWNYGKGTLISVGIGVLMGQIILWIAGC